MLERAWEVGALVPVFIVDLTLRKRRDEPSQRFVFSR